MDKKLTLRHFICLFIFWICITRSAYACTLPSGLVGQWVDVSKNLTVTFTSTKLTGWVTEVTGETKNAATCISNLHQVYVFRGDQQYSDITGSKSYFICMKLTKESDNLYYYYLLADPNTKAKNDRIYTPDTNPSQSTATCDYCSFTGNILDSEYNLLQSIGTSETPATTPTLCLPCDKNCSPSEQSNTEDESSNLPLILGLSIPLGLVGVGSLVVISVVLYKIFIVKNTVAAKSVVSTRSNL